MPMLLKFIRESMGAIRDLRKYNKGLKIKRLAVTPMKGTKTVTYKCEVQSESRKGKTHMAMVRFHDIEFYESKKKDARVATYEGNTFYFKTPDIKSNKVALKCGCEDWQFMWEYQLFSKGSMIGNYRKYRRKTAPPPIGYPYKNPGERLGFCKHIYTFLKALESRGKVIR